MQSSNNGVLPDMGMFLVAPAATFHHPHYLGQYPPSAFLGFDGSCPATAALGVIPLLPDELVVGGCSRGGGGGLQLWQSVAAPAAPGYYSCAGGVSDAAAVEMEGTGGRARVDYQNLLPLHGDTATDLPSYSAAAASATPCRDCGNQAKKDCIHQRCRTCCKNRGLDCSTHVKSTWIPASRRRESHPFSTSAAVTASRSQSSSSGAKKPRLMPGNNHSQTSHASTSNNTAATATTGDSGGSMPKQVMAHAEFRCVRVSPVDGGEDDQYAYQAVVRIGGHVFKGFLYDQGLDIDSDNAGKGIYGSGLFHTMSSPPIIVPPSSESQDVYGGASAGIGIGGSNVGIGNPLFQ